MYYICVACELCIDRRFRQLARTILRHKVLLNHNNICCLYSCIFIYIYVCVYMSVNLGNIVYKGYLNYTSMFLCAHMHYLFRNMKKEVL